MNKEATEWISSHSKDVYMNFCKLDSFQDRFRNLIPLYAALGTGYYFMGTRFPHYYTDGNLAFFYVPFSLGLLLLIASVSLILYSMFWMVGLEILGDPVKFYETCESIEGEHPEGHVKNHLDRLTAKERCEITKRNLEHIDRRGRIMNRGARIGVISFAFLFLAAPRFISTSWNQVVSTGYNISNTMNK